MSSQPAGDVSQAKNSDQPDKKPNDKKPSAKAVFKVVLWIIVILMIVFGIAGKYLHISEAGAIGLLGAGILLGIILLIWGRLAVANIEPKKDAALPKWDPNNADAYLTAIFDYVVERAVIASNWYWGRKKSKAAFSQVIRFGAWLLAGVAGILPILGAIRNNEDLKNGLLASLLVGTAAALLGLDKIFGFSSGWTRYVLTGTMIGKSLEQFRVEWAGLKAKAGDNPGVEAALPLMERAGQFLAEIQGMVLQETKEWVTEFQSNVAQMEKDIGAQLEKLKLQVEQTVKDKEAASKPGAIQLNVQNNGKAKPGDLRVTLTDSKDQKIAQDTIAGFTWPKAGLAPGIYHLTVDAPANNQVIPQAASVIVKPAEVTTVAMSL